MAEEPNAVGTQDNTEASTQTEPQPEPTVQVEESAQTEQTQEEMPKDGLLGEKKEAPPVKEVPEEYKFEMPEGLEPFPDASLKDLGEIAKGMNLSQAEASMAAELANRLIHKLIEQDNAEQKEFAEQNAAEWKKHPEAALRAESVNGILEKHGMRDHFVERGYVYDAKLLGLLADLGKIHDEARSITGGDAPSGVQTRWYPNSPELYK